MADKHSLNYEVRELNLGTSFTNNKTSQYHTIKYDFKPASVDVNKMATVDTGTNNQVTVTVPHLDGAGVPQTVFKGSQRPYTKECVLIIDRVTGEVTLEKLSSNIQVKKTRQESAQKPRPLTPVTTDFTNTTQRSTSRTRVTTNKRVNPNPGPPGIQSTATGRFNGQGGIPAGMTAAQKAAQQAAQPQSMVRSPIRAKTSPPQAAPWSGGGNSTLASLPMIGLDDSLAPLASPPTAPSHNGYSAPPRQPPPERGYSERMASERMASERMAAERMASERMAAERMASERMAAERMAAERMVSERMAAERMASERIAPERNASMQERPPSHAVPPTNHSHAPSANHNAQNADDSSSSSSSDSDSDSGSDSDDNDASAPQPLPNGNAENNPPLLTDVLNDDLCLSESGSDSD